MLESRLAGSFDGIFQGHVSRPFLKLSSEPPTEETSEKLTDWCSNLASPDLDGISQGYVRCLSRNFLPTPPSEETSQKLTHFVDRISRRQISMVSSGGALPFP